MRPHGMGTVCLIAAVALAGLAAACARKSPEAPPPAPAASTSAPSSSTGWTPEPKPPESLQVQSSADAFNKQGVLKRIHFDTDKYEIRPEFRQVLKDNAAWLLAHPQFKLIIEGHCDERNTEAYNLALGERRAAAAKDYLVGLGLQAAKIQTVSYGKARPLCAKSEEACWQQNRRCEFVLSDDK